MANIYEFSSDKIDIFAMNIDKSGSMGESASDVRRGLEMYKESFEGFPEANSIAVSLSTFSDNFYPGEFKSVSEFSTYFSADGGTALHYSIVKGGEYLQNYMKEVLEKTGVIPRATYIVFSDGQPCGDPGSPSKSKAMINKLNMAGITTVFVAFGPAMTSEFGQELGFQSTIKVESRETLSNFLGQELSKSCKEQSKSLKALGSNFFSQAVGNENSQGYSHASSQALDDDDFMDDIEDI